ncbi:GAF and ANTAR domain-containing protein [Streptomyces sp. NPDC016845]|uniref:GAF and ANTAR domain-containing protein n=1 Tax=Streptomyces sp. NPDC016845 TaxID=3364972 RepID=UPI00379D092A
MDDDHYAAVWRRVSAAAAAGGPTLATACRACADDLDADFAGATLVVAGELRLIACATDERARLAEDAQLVAGEGPCTEAYTKRVAVEVPDLNDAVTRWPVFAPIALQQGARCVLAAPLIIGDAHVGALDLYRCEPRPFTAAQKALATAYARLLALLALDEHPRLLTSHSRPTSVGPQGYPPVVHMAAGVVAARYDLSPDDALARLRAHAFSHDQTLSRTAQDVIESRRLD